MEKQLFDWVSCDLIDEGIWKFYDVTIKNIPGIQRNMIFELAILNLTDGLLVLCDDGERWEFKLTFNVERI